MADLCLAPLKELEVLQGLLEAMPSVELPETRQIIRDSIADYEDFRELPKI